MLPLVTHGRQRHRRVKKAEATHGDWWQRRSRAGGVLVGGATLLRGVSAACVAQCWFFGPIRHRYVTSGGLEVNSKNNS